MQVLYQTRICFSRVVCLKEMDKSQLLQEVEYVRIIDRL